MSAKETELRNGVCAGAFNTTDSSICNGSYVPSGATEPCKKDCEQLELVDAGRIILLSGAVCVLSLAGLAYWAYRNWSQNSQTTPLLPNSFLPSSVGDAEMNPSAKTSLSLLPHSFLSSSVGSIKKQVGDAEMEPSAGMKLSVSVQQSVVMVRDKAATRNKSGVAVFLTGVTDIGE